MTTDLTWLLVVILVGAGVFLAAAIWALTVGIRRWLKLQQSSGSRSSFHRHTRRQRRLALRQAKLEPQPAANDSLQPPWYAALFLTLLAILFAWVVVWVLQISGRLNGLTPQAISGVSFYWQSLILPAAALGVTVIILARSKQRSLSPLSSPVEAGPQDMDPQDKAPDKVGRIHPLFTGAASGLGMWLAAMFLQRILAAWIPASFGGQDAVNLNAAVQWNDPFKVGLLRDLPAPGGSAGLWLAVIFVALITPAVSELFFRGYVLPLWAKSWGWTSGLVSSALLSAAFSLNILSLPAMFLAGIGLGWLARYGSAHSPVSGAAPPQSSRSLMAWLPQPLQSAWLAHTVLNVLMVAVWLWH